MGTRGLYGFRFNGVEKFTYNHYDSYPDGLGAEVANFCQSTSVEKMKDIFSRIQMVNNGDKPTPEQVEACKSFTNLNVSTGSTDDWYCLLRELQGELCKLNDIPGTIYMIDNHDFIKDSLFCEYAYIIDLDAETLEFWVGFQRQPWEDNPYGTDSDDGYYPCKRYATFAFGEDAGDVVERMKYAEEHPEEEEDGDEDEKITKAAEACGWSVRIWNDGNKNICFSNSSPEGEDLELEYMYDDHDDLAEQLFDEYNDFSPNDHVCDLIRSGATGLPSVHDLCDDADEIERMYYDLYEAIRDCM